MTTAMGECNISQKPEVNLGTGRMTVCHETVDGRTMRRLLLISRPVITTNLCPCEIVR
jgi:hypothetical protein